ncbi:alpha/beta hydrolase [Gallaecimonas mangrovi]|uniref:alpha/beta hydrolase n=1 Tax=Gallaecimonas mangrovi TaxID=2291597 RepID=UPI000E20B804|nr:dienelactone hydrolase family protein [Gallaecimonas mangrovi]
MDYLPHQIVETGANITASVIWLHGLGASGDDFVPMVPELGLPAGAGVRFIFPNAPAIPVTVNGGYVMPAWYDILSLDIERKLNQSQLQASSHAIQALIEREIARGISSEHIVVAGFSQGGAVAYEAALSFGKPLAGLLALSTYFATRQSVNVSAANQSLPVAIYHGTQDPVVPELLGQQAKAALQQKGLAPHYRTYPMEHCLCFEQVKDIGQWLTKVLALK